MAEETPQRLSRSLRRQCDSLGVRVTAVEMARSNEGWIVGEATYRRPEPAALALLCQSGWIGACCEGGPILLLIKSACFEMLARLNQFGRGDTVTRYLEAQFTIHAAHTGPLIDTVGDCPLSQILQSFDEIYESPFIRENYPGVTRELIKALHRALGAKLPDVTRRFAADPYSYRRGWPDITAVRGDQLLLQEVKTQDRLHGSQIATISDIVLPAGLPCEVIQLVPSVERFRRSPE